MIKLRQRGNLVARKFLKKQTLTESFLILLQHFLGIKQFCGSVKEITLGFLQNGHILNQFIYNIPKLMLRQVILWTKRTLFLCRTPMFLQKVFGPILRLPETLLSFSTSGRMGATE